MKELLSLPKAIRTESVCGINIEYVATSIATLDNPIPIQSRLVGMGQFAFSSGGMLHTADAYTCTVIVTRKRDKWGLYHDVVYPESKLSSGNWVYVSHRERLLRFLGLAASADEDKLSSAFLFGSHMSVKREFVEASRMEAERALIKFGGLEETEVIRRWNNDRSSSVNVLVNPLTHSIRVENVSQG